MALLAALVVVGGCGDDDGGPDQVEPDAQVDDGGITPDAGPEPEDDAGLDAGVDAGPPPEPYDPVLLSGVDKSENVALSDGQLSAEWFFIKSGGVRSTRAIAPGEGVFYFEAQIPVPFNEMQIGLGTAANDLGRSIGYDDPETPYLDEAGYALHTGGQIYVNGGYHDSFTSTHLRYGFVIDYRGVHPVVHLLIDRGDGTVESKPPFELTSITEPVYAMLTGLRRVPGMQVTVNFGNDTLNFPFGIDARQALIDAGRQEVADALVLGLGGTHANPWNAPPVLTAPALGATVDVGQSTTLNATASDAEDGSLDATILWEALSTGYGVDRVVGTGPSFTYTPAVLGVHPIRVSVVDSGGKRASATVDVVAMGTLAQQAAGDVRFEVEPGLSGTGIVLRDDGLAARWTTGEKAAIRANQAVYGEFRYFEVHRLGASYADEAGGLVIGGTSLDPYPFSQVDPVTHEYIGTPPSCSLNIAAGIYQNLIFRENPWPRDAVEYYGFAVDYRGEYPIVYFVWAVSADPTTFEVRRLDLTDATVPIYPMLYGGSQGTPEGSFDIEANFGATPFHYDPAAILTNEGIDPTGLELCWADADCPAAP